MNQENMMKLSAFFEMANFYSRMDKIKSEGPLDPFVALQKCAAFVNQRVNCVTKASVNSQGQREILCQVFAGNVNLSSALVTSGKNTACTKTTLAQAVLAKITQPYLRIISDAQIGSKLEGSPTPFSDNEFVIRDYFVASHETAGKHIKEEVIVKNEVGESTNAAGKHIKEEMIAEKEFGKSINLNATGKHIEEEMFVKNKFGESTNAAGTHIEEEMIVKNEFGKSINAAGKRVREEMINAGGKRVRKEMIVEKEFGKSINAAGKHIEEEMIVEIECGKSINAVGRHIEEEMIINYEVGESINAAGKHFKEEMIVEKEFGKSININAGGRHIEEEMIVNNEFGESINLADYLQKNLKLEHDASLDSPFAESRSPHVNAHSPESFTFHSPLEPAVIPKVQDFDSYIAWRCERHPTLKIIRMLGHMYSTLPYKNLPSQPENPAAILKLLENVSGIELVIEMNLNPDNYSMVMDRKVTLFSGNVSSQDPTHFISRSVLETVSMPYLCLSQNSLQASYIPFRGRANFSLGDNNIVLDTWQTHHERDVLEMKYSKPVKVDGFCIFQSDVEYSKSSLKESAKLCCKGYNYIVIDDRFPVRLRIGYMIIDSKIIGGTILPEVVKNETVKIIEEACMNCAKKCHWTIHKMVQTNTVEDRLYPGDVLPQLQSGRRVQQQLLETNHNGINSSNKGRHLVRRMGCTREAIVKIENGIAEPVSASREDIPVPEKFFQALLDAYVGSSFHRTLFIPCFIHQKRLVLVNMAVDRNLAINVTKRGVNVLKKFNPHNVFVQCMMLGGKSDVYYLVPPQEIAYEPPYDIPLLVSNYRKFTRMRSTKRRKENKSRRKELHTSILVKSNAVWLNPPS